MDARPTTLLEAALRVAWLHQGENAYARASLRVKASRMKKKAFISLIVSALLFSFAASVAGQGQTGYYKGVFTIKSIGVSLAKRDLVIYVQGNIAGKLMSGNDTLAESCPNTDQFRMDIDDPAAKTINALAMLAYTMSGRQLTIYVDAPDVCLNGGYKIAYVKLPY